MAIVNIKKLLDLVEQGYLTVQKHETMDLFIFNYSSKTQYDAFWTEETKMSRGLIVNSMGEIKARPFEKFFNLGEIHEELPNESYEVYEKMDGSLGILYWEKDVPKIATRGNFYSKQAIKANKILQEKYPIVKFDPKFTYLFEIIYPENRIVIDYGDTEELILLAVLDTETGKELVLEEFDLPFPKVRKVSTSLKVDELSQLEKENKEGFVVRCQSGLRLKVKFADYVRLHKLVTGVTPKAVWGLMKTGMGVYELLEHVPDEFYSWVKQTQERLNAEFSEIEKEVILIFNQVSNLSNRREQAEFIRKNSKYPGVVFAMLDNKNYKDLIWKLVRPKLSEPFKREI